MDPLDYAALAVLPTIELRIVTRTKEANEIRPELSELAVRWPEAAGELTVIEKHLGHAPTQLSMVVKGALALPDDEEPFKAAFSSAGESFDEASAAFERVLELLDSKG